MLHVIGLGVVERAELSTSAQQAIRNSAAIIGSPRQLQTVVHYLSSESGPDLEVGKRVQHELPPLQKLEALLQQYAGQVVCLLASGDPLYYGIGRWLLQRYAREQLRFYPAVSSIQAACHALGLALQDVQVVSLHGRSLAALRRHLAQHQVILCLTDAQSSPQALAQLCCDTGFAESRLWVCEQLGYQQQQVRAFAVTELAKPFDSETTDSDKIVVSFDALHISVLEVRRSRRNGGCAVGTYLPAGPGIADADFITDAGAGAGLLTKREVRMAILGLLPAPPGQVFWDIGAGCGGVAVEWALLQAQSQVCAIEHNVARLNCLRQNCERFGVVDNLTVVDGRAPDCLATLPDPAAVFIGGSDGVLVELLVLCWARLPVGGVLVASAVTESTRAALLSFADNLDVPEDAVETLQIAVNKGSKLAGQWVYRPKLPVTLFQLRKW